MSIENLREQVLAANRHEGGLKIQPCLAVEAGWLEEMQVDVRKLLQEWEASDVMQKSHPTNWVRPFGKGATQHNLFNRATPDSRLRKLTPDESGELGRGEDSPMDEYIIGTVDGGPLLLKVLDHFGCEITTLEIHGRRRVEFCVPVHAGQINTFQLHTEGGGAPVPGDARPLNFRVFRLETET